MGSSVSFDRYSHVTATIIKIQNSFITAKMSVSLHGHSCTLPLCLAVPHSDVCLHNCAFSRISHKWNHTICTFECGPFSSRIHSDSSALLHISVLVPFRCSVVFLCTTVYPCSSGTTFASVTVWGNNKESCYGCLHTDFCVNIGFTPLGQTLGLAWLGPR